MANRLRGVSDLIRSTAGWRLKQARWLRLIDPGVIILVRGLGPVSLLRFELLSTLT